MYKKGDVISLTTEEQAIKAALTTINNSTKYIVFGFFVLLSVFLSIIQDHTPTPMLILLFSIHFIILFIRFILSQKYLSIEKNIVHLKDLHRWILFYGIGVFSTGLFWGLLFFILDTLSPQEYFIIYGMNIGIASIALFSLGLLSSLFLAFNIPLLGLSLVWLFSHGDPTFTTIGLITIFGFIYYLFFAKHYTQHFYKMFVSQSKIQDQLIELKKIHQINANLHERMELALEGTRTSVLDFNLLTDESYISKSWKEMLGYRDDELTNDIATWKKFVHPDDFKPAMIAMNEKKRKKQRYFETVHRLRHKDGYYVWILGRAQFFYDKDSQLVRMIGTHTDISKEKATELKNIQQSQIIDQIHDSIISTTLKGTITTWNKGSQLIFGYTKEEALGQSIFMLSNPNDLKSAKRAMQYLLKYGEYKADARLFHKDGHAVYVSLSSTLLRNEFNQPIKMISYAQNISQRKEAQEALFLEKEKLHHLANHDVLTQLPNRLLFHDRLEQAIKEAQRNHNKMALLFLDLDHFKKINDSLGHDIGDEVLRSVTLRLQEVIRKEDTVSRLGGDEFTIILKDLKSGQDASYFAQKIIDSISQAIKIHEHELYVTSSIGITLYPDDGVSSSDLLKYADSAMYKAKEEGRNNFQFYAHEMTQVALEKLVMETQLKDAIKNEEFVVNYQAQVDGSNNTIIGMEALVRWLHPSMGLIPPFKFLPLAESTGMIVEIDRFVMKTAIAQLVDWYKKGLNPGVLAINLAVKQIQSPDFIEYFQKLLHTTSCKSEWIELEVTEGQIMTKPQESIKILNNIKTTGVKIAVDDFGTGYSSLSYLKKLPIDKLKIDQSFVSNLPNDTEDVAIAQAVIALAKSLHLDIIAEGVETIEQRDFMVENGCKNIQGYFYSQPVGADKFELLLQQGFQKI